jgi:hypothetical protein
MNNATPLEPQVFTTSRTATSLTIKCMHLNLFQNATFIANLMDVEGNVIETRVITLTHEQYLEWNNNDDYIVNLVSGILGVSPKSDV